MKQIHDVLLAPKSDKTVMFISCLKINKLSTYKLYTYHRPGFTGCVLHAACKYLIIFQRLTATTALVSPLLPRLPTSRALAAVAMTTGMKSLGTLSLTMGTYLAIRTLLYISQTGLWELFFNYTIKSCGNWNSRGEIVDGI